MSPAGRGPLTDGGGRPSGPTVLASSESHGLARRACTELLAERLPPGDGLVLVTDDAGFGVSEVCGTVDPLAREAVALVVAGSEDDRGRPGEAGPDPATVEAVEEAPAPAALLGAVESAFEALAVGGRAHLLVDGLAGLPADPEPESLYGRCRELTLTGGSRPGLALVAVGTRPVPPSSVTALSHLFDVHVRLREGDGEPLARWQALTGATDGWRPWEPVEVPPATSR